MKKLLALFLILAMLIPMGIVTQAEEVETKPFYLVTWDNMPTEMSNVYQMAYFWVNEGKINNVESCVWYSEADSYDISEIAAALKEDFNSRPDGTRYINFTLAACMFHNLAEDVVFVENAVPKVQQWLDAFLKEYQSIGGKLDGLVLDMEFENLYSVYIQSRFSLDNPLVYKEIVENPAYAEKIRPALVERGFKFYESVTDHTPEIYGIHSRAGKGYEACGPIWDAVVRSYMNDMIDQACAPLFEYYPEAEMNDYTSKNVDPWLKEMADGGGLQGNGGGNYTTAGTSCNENFYSIRPGAFFNNPDYGQIPGYNSAVYENKTFNWFLYETNIFKNTYLASDDGEVSFWISHYIYNLKEENSVSLTPYYAETLLHMGMLNPQTFNGYIIQSEVLNEAADFDLEIDYEFCLLLVNDVMEELTRVVGAADRQPINVTPSWNEHFVLSGMSVGGKNIYRLTPDTSVISLEDFKVEGAADLTFSVNGQTVTFPQGKVIEDGSVRAWGEDQNVVWDGTCGYWIETPADVAPIITRADNYHEEYPAFGENYENYEIGTEYNYKNALPATCWEVKKTGGDSSATVVADPSNADNKVLALKGNYTLKNVKMPKNITAGDSYAENQGWEVEVTIPSDMAAEAELVLLNGSGDKKKTNDGGFKVVDNKVYYSNNGEYVELAGVTLDPGSKYRFVRNLDFNVADAYTSDYYVYDAAGKLLGSAAKVPMGTMTLPVAGVGLSCTGVTGEAVLLDNYKLYPTKVGYDFELYDVATGMKLTDLETPRAGNTAYRLSWLNATNKEKTYTVMAAYYEGDKLIGEKVIKEVKMAANIEGVDYGVVEVAEGQTVKVYLRNDNPADDDDVPGGAGNASGGMDTTLIIVIAAAAVVVIAAVVVVLLTGKKKPAKKAAKKAPAKKAPAKKAPAKKAEPKKDVE